MLIVNAIWMLLGPAGWFENVPAAVPDTGPFNFHLVRDVGAAYLTSGAGLVWAARERAFRVPLVAIATLFNVLHAITHVQDTAAGRLPPAHWLIDSPAVYLPTLALLAMTAMAWRAHERG